MKLNLNVFVFSSYAYAGVRKNSGNEFTKNYNYQPIITVITHNNNVPGANKMWTRRHVII